MWGRYDSAIRSLCMMCKAFLYMDIRGDQARPRRSRKLLHLVGLIATHWFECIHRLLWWRHPLRILSIYLGYVTLVRLYGALVIFVEPMVL